MCIDCDMCDMPDCSKTRKTAKKGAITWRKQIYISIVLIRKE